MADQQTSNPTPANGPADSATDSTAQQATGSTMHLRIDDRNMATRYANAFRSNSTADEVVLDFGFNLVEQPPRRASDDAPARDGQVRFQLENRIIMNYTTAKRLALTLGQIVRQYEDRFGEIALNRENQSGGQSSTGDTT